LALAESDTLLDATVEPLAFYQNVSPTKELRDASTEAESLVRDFGVESSMRLDVFNAKAAAEKNIKASGQWEKLSTEDRRLVEKMVCGRWLHLQSHQWLMCLVCVDP
jgi:Zn-dependent oligopeptidase